MYHAQKKHKAQHGGYRGKPTKKEVDANLDLWAGIYNSVTKKDNREGIMIRPAIGTQLKLF